MIETPPGTGIGALTWPVELELICHWYVPHLERRYENAAIRQGDLHQLAQRALKMAIEQLDAEVSL